ncbi:MAG TPA: type II toxin-antitoxin system PemK/MazF family toxin [Gemmataceae bacterium]|nr:type II toxin-antitoxin system PemK/MazF family toxin [Gemmataceae bacterium]
MKRGEVWDAILPLPAKSRPVLILSRDSMPKSRPEITVAYLTTKPRNPRIEVALTAADGVKRDSVVNLDSINTIPKDCLDKRVCQLSPAKMDEVNKAIAEALDMK